MLWTRLAPRPLDPDGGLGGDAIPVGWEVAEDPGFARIVRRGRSLAGPAAGHSVHVEVDGLRPGREYWYRFTVAQGSSPVGRTVTAPPAQADVQRLRFGFGSCQKYESGYFAAYRHLIEDRPDLFVFVGDYIYETPPGSRDAVRLHQNPEPKDVAGYRVRYATYKADPLLQAAHAACPWVVTWDDHEVSNDYGGDRDGDQNLSQGLDPAAFIRRRAAAYQVYYEHMPLRRRSAPVGPDMLLYRTLDWGRPGAVPDRRRPSVPQPAPLRAGLRRGGKGYPGLRRAPRSVALDPGRAAGALAARRPVEDPGPVEPPDPADHVRALSRPQPEAAERPGVQQRRLGQLARRPGSPGRALARRQGRQSGGAGRRHPHVRRRRRAPGRGGSGDGARSFVGGSITSLAEAGADTDRVKAANPDIRLLEAEVRGLRPGGPRQDRRQGDVQALADARREDSPISTLAAFALEDGRPAIQRA